MCFYLEDFLIEPIHTEYEKLTAQLNNFDDKLLENTITLYKMVSILCDQA